MAYKSINGKVVNGKFIHTKRKAPAGYKCPPEAILRRMAQDMMNEFNNPFSKMNQMTAQLRAAGVHCMKDDLDNGADIYELARNSVFIKA